MMGLALALLVVMLWFGCHPHVTAEMFTSEEVAELAQAVITAQATKKTWTTVHAEVFEAYTMVSGMPPTDLVLDHYMYIREANRLSKSGLQKRMKDDLPSEDE
jgi:hypothetical protein